MVRRYKYLQNITAVALEFKTIQKTVRKWIGRFEGHIVSLKNHSTAPKKPNLQIKNITRKLIIKFCKEHPSMGYYSYVVSYLNKHHSTEIPAATIYAIWKKNKLLRRDYKKSEKRNIVELLNRNTEPLKKYR